MTIRGILLPLFVAALLAGSAQRPVRLFDGRTFKGWEGDTAKVFRIEDGAIVGGSLLEALPRNEFLTTKEEFGDFDLRLEFKVRGERANAGVQIRSRRVPNGSEVRGYQADLGEGYWGSLYDEARRGKILAQADQEAVKKVLKRDDWNTYRILCEGRRIRLWINGLETIDYTEPDESIEQKGVIGLQVHGGVPMEVRYRNIVVRRLGGS